VHAVEGVEEAIRHIATGCCTTTAPSTRTTICRTNMSEPRCSAPRATTSGCHRRSPTCMPGSASPITIALPRDHLRPQNGISPP
jgi:hypothetical protein